MLKFTNLERTQATFGGVAFSMSSPDGWGSINDGPTRDEVLAWLSVDGNTPEPADPPDEQAEIAAVMATFVSLRERAINWLNAIAGRSQRAGDSATAQACDTAATALIAMTTGLTSTTASARLAELNARYLTILAVLPDPVQQEFNALKP